MLRAFIAIKLSDDLKRQIESVQADLKRQASRLGGSDGIAWTRPEGIHLTLKFLGDISEAQVEPLAAMLRKAASQVERFTLEASGVGAFPNSRAPRVIWLGLHGGERDMEALRRLQTELEEGAAELDFPKETRAFTPHLTLARLRDRRPAALLEKILAESGERVVGKCVAATVSLIKSELRPSGAVYTTLVEVPLGGGV